MTTIINYANDSLRRFVEGCGIVRTQMARLFKQTNNLTVDRWLSGKDIYFGSLLTICNNYQLDLLSFLTHDGKPFTTSIEDIVRMEEAGLSLRQLLSQLGYEPEESTLCTLRDMTRFSPVAPAEPKPESKPTAESVSMLPTDVLDRFIAMQTQAYAHEQESLRQQRADLQVVIDHKDAVIAELRRELRRQKTTPAVGTAHGTHTALVSDDSDVAYREE